MADLRARMDALAVDLSKKRSLDIEDKSAAAALDRTSLKVAKLTEKVHAVGEDIDVAGFAKLMAAVSASELTVDRLDKKIGDLGSTGNFVSRNFDNIVSSIGQLAGAGSALLNPITVGLGALVAIMAGPFIAALLPITIGFAGLALVAVPALKKIWSAVSAGGKAWRDLTPAQKAVGDQIKNLKDEWDKLNTAIQPDLLKIFASGLQVLKDLMPALKPLIDAAAKSVAAFLEQMSDWLDSPSGKKFVDWLKTEGPKDIATLGKIFWDVAQGIGRTFDFLRNAGDTWWSRFKTLVGYFKTAFEDLLTAWNILRDKVKLVWFQMELDAENFALKVTTTMGHLPGPLGAPFRQASADIRQSLAGIEQDVRNATGQIQQDWDRLHGKTYQFGFKFDVPGTPIGPGGQPAHAVHIGNAAGGAAGAAPGWSWVGERGPELIKLRGGEQIIPNHKIPGYAMGTMFADTFMPSVPKFLAEFNAAFANTSAAMVAALRRAAMVTAPTGGPAPPTSGSVVSWLTTAINDTGVPRSWLPALEQIVSLESGGNPSIVNTTAVAGQHASGLMQMLPSTYASFATVPGGIFNPVSNAVAAIRYILSQYRSPYNIPHLFGGGYQGYDSGGWLPPGPSLALNNTGRPERVVGPGEGIKITLEVKAGDNSAHTTWLVDEIKRYVSVNGGDTQLALGERW